MPWNGRPMVAAGIAAILLAGAAFAVAMYRFPAHAEVRGGVRSADYAMPASSKSSAATAPAASMPGDNPGRGKRKCAECGLVVSLWEIEGNDRELARVAAPSEESASTRHKSQTASHKSYKMTIRMADGTSRIIYHASPTTWRPGERVILIDGAKRSNVAQVR
jgi:hypothetical protein